MFTSYYWTNMIIIVKLVQRSMFQKQHEENETLLALLNIFKAF